MELEILDVLTANEPEKTPSSKTPDAPKIEPQPAPTTEPKKEESQLALNF
jgi:hypothetical protein